ncbi:hypothetical protein PF007_g9312 [Phytophthora fragariae]|uniref:Calcineurin-like phosphoesterase domain-containing protein n=1 Tax=Phytophthora fragariae TaxID=53985 RepID=A0A6A3SJC9_9STRA|nr:hypothetical protein PF009_g10741 [Phytophthora fragariae]KAE9117343.1 hypothetical protein PF007_g9312 [Phytophthora fragariae]KAE9146414.1 hypothetical protein PF006_g8816 [Phytophthora fragariae]
MVAARKVLIVVGVLVVIGVAVGIIVGVTSGNDDDSANTSSGETTSSSSGSSTGTASGKTSTSSNVSESDLLTNTTASGSGSANKEPSSDPEEAKAALTMLAIGDWGATTDKPGSCCNKYRKVANDSLEMKIDYWAQINIAEILAQAAGDIKPSRIIGHGDNIYWNGAGPDDIDYRMETTFESVYDQPELEGIPWINVVGNHDLGGSEYICGDKDYNFRECESTEEMLKYLNLKFSLQQEYKSANSDRWKLSDHYYVESVEANGVSAASATAT